jgi:hypothetical protein
MASSATELRLIARYFGASLARASSAAPKTASVGSALLAGADTLELGLHSAMKPFMQQMQVANMFESATMTQTKPAAMMTKAINSMSTGTARL